MPLKSLFSPFNIPKTNMQVNPWAIGANAMSAMRDSTNYNQNTTLDTLNQVGGSMLGNTLNTLGDAAISTGNPWAVLGGIAGKTVGGVADTISFLNRDVPEIQTQAGGMNDQYDLGDEAVSISNMSSPGDVFKQTALSSPLGLFLAPFAQGKARRNERRAREGLASAQQNFNQVDRRIDLQKQQLLQGLVRKNDRYS